MLGFGEAEMLHVMHIIAKQCMPVTSPFAVGEPKWARHIVNIDSSEWRKIDVQF